VETETTTALRSELERNKVASVETSIDEVIAAKFRHRWLIPELTLVQIRISICERKKGRASGSLRLGSRKANHKLRRLSLDSSQQYFLTTFTINPSLGV
jgi:hypothetical protein